MARMIVLETYKKCPHIDHRGGFGKVAYIPVCRLSDKELPYSIQVTHRANLVATATYVIPDSCPLPPAPTAPQ